MMRFPTGSQWSLMVIIALMVATIAASQDLEFFASKLLPQSVAITVLILSIVALGIDFRAQSRMPEADISSIDTVEAGTGAEDWTILIIAGWIFGLALSIYLFGFMISSVLFVCLYMKWHGSGWVSSVIISVVFTSILYLVFNAALQVDLYRGQRFL